MSTQIRNQQRLVDARDDRVPAAADVTSQQAQDSMTQLVRQGQDASLRSLQVWADLARKLGPNAQNCPAGATVVAFAYDPFEKLLIAQCHVVEELVTTQRQLAQQLFNTTASASAT